MEGTKERKEKMEQNIIELENRISQKETTIKKLKKIELLFMVGFAAMVLLFIFSGEDAIASFASSWPSISVASAWIFTGIVLAAINRYKQNNIDFLKKRAGRLKRKVNVLKGRCPIVWYSLGR